MIGSLKYKISALGGRFIIKLFDKMLSWIGKDKDIFDQEEMPFHHLLESNYQQIKNEFEKAYNLQLLDNIDDFYKVSKYIGQDENWKAYPFLIWNYTLKENMEQCPITASVIKQIPGCTSAMYSLVLPHKHILPHKGVYRGVIRCLYTIYVKDETSCWIKVNGKKIYFQNNKAVYFDESYVHEVKNESDYMRAVLYIDIFRKLPFPLNVFNKLLFALIRKSEYIQTVIQEYESLRNCKVENYTPLKEIAL